MLFRSHKTKQKVMVTVPDDVPVTDAEAKALEEKGIKREIDLAHAEIANHANTAHKPMNSTLKSVLNAVKQPVAAAPLLAVIFVLIGIKIPNSWAPTFEAEGCASARFPCPRPRLRCSPAFPGYSAADTKYFSSDGSPCGDRDTWVNFSIYK